MVLTYSHFMVQDKVRPRLNAEDAAPVLSDRSFKWCEEEHSLRPAMNNTNTHFQAALFSCIHTESGAFIRVM